VKSSKKQILKSLAVALFKPMAWDGVYNHLCRIKFRITPPKESFNRKGPGGAIGKGKAS
jgi:hypothetical protein